MTNRTQPKMILASVKAEKSQKSGILQFKISTT